MNLFFTSKISDHQVFFTKEEGKHISRVMRGKIGDTIGFMDGCGNWGTAVIQSLKPEVQAEVQEIHQEPASPYKTMIGFGVTKQMVRNEWFVEKATELGVDVIVPFYGMHSQRRKLRLDRLQKIALSACKQARRFWAPEIYELVPFEQALKVCESATQKWMAVMKGEIALSELARNKSNQCIFIGPEGGFAPAEIEQGLKSDFKLVGLGSNRLRAETAGIYAASLLRK